MHPYAIASRESLLRRIVELEAQLANIVTAEHIPGLLPGAELTRLQRRIVSTLLAHRGRIVPRIGLMTAAYHDQPHEAWPQQKIIDVHVCKIRQKLDPARLAIRTITAWGYTIDAPDLATG